MLKIGVLVSGGGSNLQAIIDKQDEINGEISVVISNKEDAFALKRASNANILARFTKNESEIIAILEENQVDLVVMAGFLKIVSPKFIKAFENRIINIHPSLIPAFCGEGFYGEHVHKAVVKKGAKISGATVHFVDEIADNGPIIMQKSVDIVAEDDYKAVAQKVLKVEHEILVKSVKLFCDNKLKIQDGRVFINE